MLRKSSLVLIALILCAPAYGVTTRTAVSTTGGSWSNAASWNTGVPADTDAFIIPTGKSITFDADQSGMETGMASSQINGTGQLLMTQTPGTYTLKLAGTLSGTGSLNWYGATSTTDLDDNVILNITSTYNGSIVTISGVCNLRCTEPAVPVATTKAAYGIGVTKIYVNETLDTVWAAGRFVRVNNVAQAQQSEEFYILNTGVDGGGQYITISNTYPAAGTGLVASKLINSLVILVTRNIQFTGNLGAFQYCFNGVHGSYLKAGTRNFTCGWSTCYSNTISGGTWSGNTYGWYSCYSNTTSGGTWSGNSNGWISCYSNKVSGGTWSGNFYGWNSCYSNTTSGGTWSGNSYGWYSCYSNTSRSMTFTNTNTYQLDQSVGGLFDNCTFTGGTRYYQCTSLYLAANSYGQTTNDGGVPDAFSGRSTGGTTINSVAQYPVGYTWSYLHTPESATAPCFRQFARHLDANERCIYTVKLYKSSTGLAALPKGEVIDQYQDPLANVAFTALQTVTMTDSVATWETLSLDYTPSVPMDVLIRVTAQAALGPLVYERCDETVQVIPATTDVRLNTAVGVSPGAGSLIVAIPATVLSGVATDNTTGTYLNATPADIWAYGSGRTITGGTATTVSNPISVSSNSDKSGYSGVVTSGTVTAIPSTSLDSYAALTAFPVAHSDALQTVSANVLLNAPTYMWTYANRYVNGGTVNSIPSTTADAQTGAAAALVAYPAAKSDALATIGANVLLNAPVYMWNYNGTEGRMITDANAGLIDFIQLITDINWLRWYK